MPERCHGITASKGKRCRNVVKGVDQQFCHHHRNQKLELSEKDKKKQQFSCQNRSKGDRGQQQQPHDVKKRPESKRNFAKKLFAILSCGLVQRGGQDINDSCRYPATNTTSHHDISEKALPSAQRSSHREEDDDDCKALTLKLNKLKIGSDSETKYFLPRPSRNLFTLLNDLPFKSQEMIRAELAKPLSTSEELGFIYIYRLVDQTPSSQQQHKRRLFKVGRTANLQRRMDQWSNQCGRKVILARYLPDSKNGGTTSISYCRASHRAERLIHLELWGRFHKIYTSPPRNNCNNQQHLPGLYCKACDKQHKEWFSIPDNGILMMDAIVNRWVNYVGITVI